MAKYQWKQNVACVSTYRLLEGDKFLNQFDSDVSFEDAAKLKMDQLRYFPRTTSNPNIIKVLSVEIARKFLKHLVQNYTVQKENKQDTSTEIIEAIAGIFENKAKTVLDLAEVVDKEINFPDEMGGEA